LSHSESQSEAPAVEDAMIRLTDLELTLPSAAGPVEILRRLSLDIARGETVSVVGPSGSGKTSMMMVIAGLERPSAGRVEVAGIDLGPLDEDALALFRRRAVGIVFQAFHLVPTMTGAPSRRNPICCLPTSRPAIWTARPATTSWTCCSTCATGMAPRSC
jgi:putative ABC transport system ATP-binding protein